MDIDYESSQYVEIVSDDDTRYVEVVFSLSLTYPGSRPWFDAMQGVGDPGAGPEFAIVNIAFIDEHGKSWDVDEKFFMALVGEMIFDELVEAALKDGAENCPGVV